jgi:predicted regulator of Ras-like GTPase activity (Roadblock/LC7/MglB family)
VAFPLAGGRPTGPSPSAPPHQSFLAKIHDIQENRVIFAAMFKEALERVVTGTDGGIAGLLMDFEGIPLESYAKDGASLDIEVVGAEVSVVVKAIQRATEMLDAGATREVSFRSDKMVTLIRVINQSYFVAMTLSPEGNLGKGRYMLRTLAPSLAEELAT